ncbi:uncharacterized protein LOC111640822 isoform X1 [Centruroides sculpturatus]|uniref:uncharacterized protein LOC111640822 isoform X1 n=1 Tax=Centruroides sculpturatus TaxID=218467 RepID=UPI000C6D00DD|nr:uncharacterized protein LOC111640822 isoform X1 [Centruroides sculpturatus]
MDHLDIKSEDFWKKCTTRQFYQLLESEYLELGLDSRISSDFKFAVSLGIQHIEDVCKICSKKCKIMYRSDRNSCVLRCQYCRHNSSAFDGTFKGKCGKISWAAILSFIWHYVGLECTSSNSAIAAGISKKAAVDWCNYIRFVMLVALHNMTSFKIGGPNKTVEIDETVIYKHKYEKGRKLKSTKWVVGGICREDNSCFICQVNDFSETTLNWIIYKFVNSGSVVNTDEWKGYNNIDKLEGINIEHRMVNHSENFVNPDMGVHTQNIKRLWGYLKNKKNLPKHYTEDLSDSYMYSFMYKKFLNWPSKNPGERFYIFIKHLRNIYPGSGKIPIWKEPESVPAPPVSKNKKKGKKENGNKGKLTDKMDKNRNDKRKSTCKKESTSEKIKRHIKETSDQ